ncbi:TATA-box-binding protein-like [Brevipalpus obovatus]|uniref:TATA-box-binding protein-like n=1 Tax=Brevipalpus obovatus TaxID=246614 RepID=UPI003D9ECCAB
MVLSFTLDKPIKIDRCEDRFSGKIQKFGSKTLLIFRSGKVNVTGVTTVTEATDLVHSVFPNLVILEFRIVNLTTSFHLPLNINFQKLTAYKSIQYEPECFPGMYWRKPNSKIIVIFFHSCKGIITGSSSYLDLYESYLEFTNVASGFVRTDQ